MNNLPPDLLAARHILVELARWLRPDVYVEIGTAEGDTLRAVQAASPETECHGVDMPPGSDTFFGSWGDREIDLCFIDGDHRSEQVVRDVENAKARLAPYGLIAMHDTHPPKGYDAPGLCGDAYRALEVIEGDGWEMLTVPVVAGLTLLKRRALPAWLEPA